jgi:putative membrane protein
MKPNRTLYVALLTILLVSLSFTAACQRNREDRVEAAREDHATAPADTGTANTDTSKVLSSDERDVAMKIEQAHLGEIDLSRLAKQQASSRDVKSFADMIENDHGSALKDLQKVMNKNGVEESTNSKPAEGKEELAKLQKLSGAQFDREFMNTMVMDHQKDLDELRKAQTSVQNADLKDYINDLIPTVQKHLDKAQDLRTKLTTSTSKE